MDIIDKVRFDRSYLPSESEYDERLDAYKLLFSGAVAETVLRDLIQFTQMDNNSIEESGIMNAHKAGMQNVMDHIKCMININPTELNHEDL